MQSPVELARHRHEHGRSELCPDEMKRAGESGHAGGAGHRRGGIVDEAEENGRGSIVDATRLHRRRNLPAGESMY
eukprot:CAMPEP_0174836430 /NCGR_PEP_ID=MMETSP1114-20130205/6070_1 /TAXON_ID=312471 /ORGANISM="Neobodo designis, Strain CCAP 1951/1" /LENGTH=74 /DNA_ID=CAMNT_0016070427 /DNA_START=54 /DNA_END=277 /DNA_ORIENTATION=-